MRGRDAPYLAIVGATGTGKSDLAIRVADGFRAAGVDAEIVNADAMQLYRGMTIGTAKVPRDERHGIPHHLLDVLDVTDEATVAWYQPVARAVIEEIVARGALPILVGGSGLYVSSVLYDFRFPARDAAVRLRLQAAFERDGLEPLYERLRRMAPETAARVDSANARRVIRALEIAELGERGHGAALPDEPTPWRPVVIAALHTARDVLTPRLDSRVETMWRTGLVEEVSALLGAGLEAGATARRAIGYAQALSQLRGELDEPAAIAETQRLTRRYARRQVSWFRRYPSVHWIDTETTRPGHEVAELIDRLSR